MDRRGCSEKQVIPNLSSILQREDIRQLSWICQYPAKRTAYAVNQGGTADYNIRP